MLHRGRKSVRVGKVGKEYETGYWTGPTAGVATAGSVLRVPIGGWSNLHLSPNLQVPVMTKKGHGCSPGLSCTSYERNMLIHIEVCCV